MNLRSKAFTTPYRQFHANNACIYFVIEKDIPNHFLEEDGSLVIDCDVRVRNSLVWYPEELKPQSFLIDLCQDASSKTSDVVFFVGEKTFRARTHVLSLRCKKLYEIAKDFTNDTTPIESNSVRREIFKIILDFVYTVKQPDIEEEETAIELLRAADLFECIHLKLYIESVCSITDSRRFSLLCSLEGFGDNLND